MEKTINKVLEVGDVLYAERRGMKDIIQFKVTKIGKKYFYCDNDSRPYSLDDMWYRDANYSSATYRLYFSELEIIEEKESANMYKAIRKYFEMYNNSALLTHHQLTQILNIIK